MISVNEAREILSMHCERGRTEKLSLDQSLGFIMAEAVFSPIDVPSFDNSAMDGYAVKFENSPGQWKVNEVIQAGDTSPITVKSGEAARIFTGAKMPGGANTVIPQELVEFDQRSNEVRYEGDKIQPGSNVRLKGSQCEEGDLILEEGALITPGVIGLLASVGLAEVKVFKAPSVAYIITGDELKEVGSELKAGEIYNSNGPMLKALLNKTGITDVFPYKASDDKEELQKTIDRALQDHDVLILSGGISVGDYDFVKECLERSGVKELFYKIKQRPGKPMFAGKKEEKWIFALPGNPASVLSCFVQYVRPCLRAHMGHQNTFLPDHVLPLSGDTEKKPGLTFFMKAKKSGGEVQLLSGQQSFNLQAFATADCLVELPEDAHLLESGSRVNVYNL